MFLGCARGQGKFGLGLQIHWNRQTPRNYTSASQVFFASVVLYDRKGPQVRDQFLDWMTLHSSIPHTLLKPSPVLPKNDPRWWKGQSGICVRINNEYFDFSLSFVNSGMVQFKPVFQVNLKTLLKEMLIYQITSFRPRGGGHVLVLEGRTVSDV